ncbi:DoxX family protein [Sphingomonas sp. GB1N7]|uniref:DoxX family protein n=1 Tax=Parasphingomonas caseinilytica TaxID=3096158 RepID=UPI002FCAB0EF
MNTTRTLWIGRILTGLAILFFLMDAGGKLIAPATMIANSPPLGLPASVQFYRLLGAIALICTALYAWPRTSVLGAVLLTGYLGGAIACQLRVASPIFSHTLFGVYIALFVWGGLWLRDARLRAIFPIIR